MDKFLKRSQPSTSGTSGSGSESKPKKNRHYDDKYLKYGFTVINNKPQCVICGDVLSQENMKPSKLMRHLTTKHQKEADKPLDFFERKLKALSQQQNTMIQLSQVDEALRVSTSADERDSLLSLQNDLQQLVALTRESLAAVVPPHSITSTASTAPTVPTHDGNIDDEYALFMAEMAESGAYNKENNKTKSDDADAKNSASGNDSDIEEELSSLPGMKCGVYHTHKWGGQPTLHNAMVASVEPCSDRSQFKDLRVRILFTHPTHAEMLPCPFYLDGDCRFSDDQCRYSHGEIVPFSSLKEAIEPKFESLKPGNHVLIKLKPPDGEDISLTKKSSEKYYLWHRGIIKSLNAENRRCVINLEQGGKSGEKRKSGSDEHQVPFEELFPLNDTNSVSSESEDSLSDTEYPEARLDASDVPSGSERDLLLEKSFQYNGPAMGEWERHTRGIGSKLMFAMGYVAGTGLGVSSDGRLEPVPARVLPVGKSLDHCMSIAEKHSEQDPFKVEQKLKRLQKREEERNRRAYEREQEKERRNVFNFLNKTLGDQKEEPQTSSVESRSRLAVKQSTSKNLNIEQFKINEDVKRVERDMLKLKNSLYRHAQGSNIHKNMSAQLAEKTRELDTLRSRELEISREQNNRKDKQKLTLF